MTVPNEEDSGRVRARTQGISQRSVFAWLVVLAVVVAAAAYLVIWRPYA